MSIFRHKIHEKSTVYNYVGRSNKLQAYKNKYVVIINDMFFPHRHHLESVKHMSKLELADILRRYLPKKYSGHKFASNAP